MNVELSHSNILLATFKMVNLKVIFSCPCHIRWKSQNDFWWMLRPSHLWHKAPYQWATKQCAFDQQYFHKSAQSLISVRLPPIKISTGRALRSGIKGNARKIQVHQLKMIELISSIILIICHLVRRDQLWFISWVMWLIMTLCFFGDIRLCQWRM